MNTEKVSKTPVTTAGEKQPLKIEFLDEIMALGTPVGTWGGSKDILLRIRELKPVAANKDEAVEEVTGRAALLGPFGASTNILLTMRNAKPVAANVGGQGGGQN
ncbi:MAG TPA: hypothetical protein VF020_01970 [Chthoniobacterales bacterium]